MQQQTMIQPVTMGLRFTPTDSELMLHLNKMINKQPLTCDYIRSVDVYKYNPWELVDTNTSCGNDALYFFTPRERKYLNGSRPNRAAGGGFWKATAAGKKICENNQCIGLKNTLVFYEGKASEGKKTNWIMHEYVVNQPPRLPTGSMRLDDCVLCRIRERKPAAAAASHDSGKTIHETSENDNLTSHKRSRTESDQQHDVPAQHHHVPAQHHLQLRQPDLPLMHQQFQLLRHPADLPLMHQHFQLLRHPADLPLMHQQFQQPADLPIMHQQFQLRQAADLPIMHQQFQLRQAADLRLMHQQNQPALQYTSQQHGSVPQQQQNQPGGELDYSARRKIRRNRTFSYGRSGKRRRSCTDRQRVWTTLSS